MKTRKRSAPMSREKSVIHRYAGRKERISMSGKEKCKILKEIRHQIARENDISLITEACSHKGECRGTCPRCEAEVRYLERELKKRERLRKTVALAGISVGLTLALSGCAAETPPVGVPGPAPSGNDLTGDVAWPDDNDPKDEFVTDGEIAPVDMIDGNDENE